MTAERNIDRLQLVISDKPIWVPRFQNRMEKMGYHQKCNRNGMFFINDAGDRYAFHTAALSLTGEVHSELEVPAGVVMDDVWAAWDWHRVASDRHHTIVGDEKALARCIQWRTDVEARAARRDEA